jgi:putative glutamine amidotransferase
MDPVVISVQMEQLKLKVLQEYLDYSEFRVENYDGLLIPGGGDINPIRYGQKLNGSYMILDALDDLQFDMLDAFVKAQKPVLGICRGHQIINVYFGGTLIQHLATSIRHFPLKDEPDKIHDAVAMKGSWLEKLYGAAFTHNSSHHQAVDKPGDGIVIDSWSAADGVVEAYHHAELPVFAVQWHPERMCLAHARTDTVDGMKVFDFFARLCCDLQEAGRRTHAHDIMSDMLGL